MNISTKTQNIIYGVIIGISVLAMVILCAGYFKDKKIEDTNKEIPQTAALKPKEDKVKVTIDTRIIEEGLDDMGFLVTQEYYFTMVETYTKEKKVLKFFDATSELAYSYEGSVTAGVDFERIKIRKDDENKVIRVEVPKAEIQTVIIDKDSFKTYSEKESMWNKLDMSDFNSSLSEFEKAAKDKALENGILDRAQERAEELVYNFVSKYQGASQYKVICE